MQRALCILTAFFLVSVLPAQETPNRTTAGIFPLSLILDGAENARCGVWRPDWPFEIPPDAFRVQSADVSRIVVEGEGLSGDFPPLVLRFNSDGLTEEFPFILNGQMVQAGIVYTSDLEIHKITLTFPCGEEFWTLEILERRNDFPSLVRAFHSAAQPHGGDWFFIFFSRIGMNEILETWYDPVGNFLGAFSFSFTAIGRNLRISSVRVIPGQEIAAEFFFDSRGLLTGVDDNSGVFRVFYFLEDLPRYWERRPLAGAGGPALIGAGNFYLQWDQRGLLTRLVREGPPLWDGDDTVDLRYDYIVDEKGNWVKRQEIRMIKYSGLFFPRPGTTFRRILEYNNE